MRDTEHTGKYDTLAEREVKWFRYVVRAIGTPANTILQGKVKVKGLRGRLVIFTQWLDDVKE